jgi:uncharacterized protein YdeI (YjbR/CyaY-like superfamily)
MLSIEFSYTDLYYHSFQHHIIGKCSEKYRFWFCPFKVSNFAGQLRWHNMEHLTFETRGQFRQWLVHHHDKEDGLWLVYYKKNTGIPSIRYEEAVEEALCFGWIDSKIKSIDDLQYKQVFTPRRPRSVWSETNKKRIAALLEAGLMTPAGIKVVEEGKKSGKWQESYAVKKYRDIPDDLAFALSKNPLAGENFKNFAPSFRSTYIAWIERARRPQTRIRRIEKVVQNSLKNQKPGI